MAIQDHNLNLPVQDYRDLKRPSYSLLAAIAKQGVEVVGGESIKLDLKFGSLVDDLCFEPREVSKKYYSGNSQTPPTANVKKIVDLLMSKIGKVGSVSTDSSGLKRKSFRTTSDLSNTAYDKIIIDCARELKIYPNYMADKILRTVRNSTNSAEYFKDKMLSLGKILIKPQMWKLAHEAAKTLMYHEYSGKYFAKGISGIEIFYQYQFDAKVNGRQVKGMLDCLIVNHKAKVIIPVDLKTGEEPGKNFPMIMLGYKYYLQAALYKEALKNIVSNDWDLQGYTVNNFEFLYLSKVNVFKPLIYEVPDELHQKALTGFTDRYGYEHEGLFDLLEDYYACAEGNICDYTEKETLAKGRVVMNNLIKE
jgi:hypothetical protein